MLYELSTAHSYTEAQVSLFPSRVLRENSPKNLLDIPLRLPHLLTLNSGNFHNDSDSVEKSTFKELIKNCIVHSIHI